MAPQLLQGPAAPACSTAAECSQPQCGHKNRNICMVTADEACPRRGERFSSQFSRDNSESRQKRDLCKYGNLRIPNYFWPHQPDPAFVILRIFPSITARIPPGSSAAPCRSFAPDRPDSEPMVPLLPTNRPFPDDFERNSLNSSSSTLNKPLPSGEVLPRTF